MVAWSLTAGILCFMLAALKFSLLHFLKLKYFYLYCTNYSFIFTFEPFKMYFKWQTTHNCGKERNFVYCCNYRHCWFPDFFSSSSSQFFQMGTKYIQSGKSNLKKLNFTFPFGFEGFQWGPSVCINLHLKSNFTILLLENFKICENLYILLGQKFSP